MKSITFGQFYPSSSPMHRLDPRMKVILAILYIVCSFLCQSTAAFIALLVSSVLIILLSNIPAKIVLRSVRPILIIIMITSLINVFMVKGEPENLLVSWNFINIYTEGVFNAIFIVVRIFALVIGSSMFLTYTTTPIMLTDAIERLLSPLHKLFKLKVHEFAMMMTIALRFIPTFVDEADKIISAQKSRGMDFNSGGLIKRAKAFVPVLIPLFASAYHKAIDLATAMECRCYRGGDGRTRMTVLKLKPRDFVAFLFMLLLGVGVVLLNRVPFLYVM
ncbi:MAG: energy-coupling factor transporter transmembrane protein EcfT [Clostridia bacterium]|nr:energy-coupling factor transporter transmembrane protein EcfT [Clostridia bacterium]